MGSVESEKEIVGMMRYGLPYKGSKNKIAEEILGVLPRARTLYDLFGGGCAITHAALMGRKYERVVCNDIGLGPVLFRDAAMGKYKDEKRWISREEFEAKKRSDPYISLIWSFGNNGEDYLYGREIEAWKKALWAARVWGDRSLLREMGIEGSGSRQDVRRHAAEYKRKYIDWCAENTKDRMYDLQSLERLQSLESLQSLERLVIYWGG